LIFKPKQIIIGLLSIPFGCFLGSIEYAILRPTPLVGSPSLDAICQPALIRLVCKGFEEELIFRGFLDKAAGQLLRRNPGTLYVSARFAVLHIGYLSIPDLIFVFVVGGLFALFTRRVGSIVPPSITHGAVNITLFLIMPFLL